MKFSVSKSATVAVTVLFMAKFGLMTASAQEEAAEIEEGAEVTQAEPAPEPAAPILPEMLADISEERMALEEKRTALAAREADLILVEEAVSKQMTELRGLETELKRLLETANMRHGEDLDQLVSIYRSMKPVQAGQIIGTMDLEVATLVISTMDARTSGPILANMDVTRAQTISKIIYERSKLPGDQREIVIPTGG